MLIARKSAKWYYNDVPGDKIVKVFPRGDKVTLKILKACGTDYPVETHNALYNKGACFPFNIADIPII